MKSKYNFIIEKILFYIPFLIFLLYTSVHNFFAMKSNSNFISILIRIFNYIYMKGSYIFFALSLILAIYILINGNKKQHLIMIATLIGCFFMSYNLFIIENNTTNLLTALLFISSYLIGIFYTLSLFIYLKNKDINEIKKKVIKGAKFVVIYISIIFILAYISNTNQYSYIYPEQGITAWFRSTNGLGHALVFILPLFVLFYIKDKKNNCLFYIVIITILDLLIGTKACYYGLLSTLIITTLYLFIDFIKNKKYHYFKLLSFAIILFMFLSFNNDLYVTTNIEKGIRNNTNEQGQFEVVDFVISGRDENADIIKTAFKNSNAFTKIFGLGLYYPRFNFIYVELDLLEILYSRGIYGLLLYITFFGIIIFNIFKEAFHNIKKCFNIDFILIFLTLDYIGVASIFVGHVMFNLMSLSVAIMVMVYFIYEINKKDKKIKLN